MADKATSVSFRYGTAGEHENFRGVKGEITVDISTPTIWVHTGDQSKGTPLARQDMKNVARTDIAAKGIARDDLLNVSVKDPINARKALLPLNYASRDMDDITERGYTKLSEKYAEVSLSNVQKNTVVTLLGNDTFVKTDLSNTSKEALAGIGVARADLVNVTASTIKGKGIASDTLDNVTLTDEIRKPEHLDLQKVSNLVALTDPNAGSAGTYPTAASVKTAIDNIPAMITNIIVDTLDTSQTFGQVTITVSKAPSHSPVIKEIDNHIIEGTWANPSSSLTWIFTPQDATETFKVINKSWVITLV